MIVDVVLEERYWYPDDGGIVWVAGYHLVDADGRFLGRGSPGLRERGLRIANVAGAGAHHADVLDAHDLAPGTGLLLRRDPGNEHDPNAIAVDAAPGAQVGWVPRELAAELAADLDAGREWTALVLREHRRSPRDPRDGLVMLLAPEAVELNVTR